MWRWFLGVFVVLAALTMVDLVVARTRGTRPLASALDPFEAARSPIVVGLIHSQTGPLAISERSLVDAEVMALEEINARGGTAGRPVRWEIADGRSDPASFSAQARRLIEKEKVEVIVGGWTAECRRAMIGVVEEHESLLIFPANFEGIERSAHALYPGGSANQIVFPAVRWCVDALKARRFFVVGTEEVWSRVASEMAKDAIKAADGELAGETYLPLVGGDAPTLAEAVRAARPDVVINAIVGDANLPFYSAFRRAGLASERVPIVSLALAEDELRRFPPGDVAGHYAAFSYYQGLDRRESVEFVRKFKARYGEDRAISDTMVAAYNGVFLWANAVEEAGTADPKVLADRFDRQSLDAPEGIVTIDPDSRIGWRPFIVGKARPDGQFDLAWSIAKPVQPQTFASTRSKTQWRALLDDLKARWGGRWSSSEPAHPDPTRSAK